MIYINRETNELCGRSDAERWLDNEGLDPNNKNDILEYFRVYDESLAPIIAELLKKGYDVLRSYPIDYCNYSAFNIRITGNHIDAFKKISQDPDLGILFSLEYEWVNYTNDCNEITCIKLSRYQWPETYADDAYYTNLKRYIDTCAHIYERIKLLPVINEATSEDIADDKTFC